MRKQSQTGRSDCKRVCFSAGGSILQPVPSICKILLASAISCVRLLSHACGVLSWIICSHNISQQIVTCWGFAVVDVLIGYAAGIERHPLFKFCFEFMKCR